MEGAYESNDAAVAPAGWPKPVGVLSLVFGILAVTCGVLGVGMMFATDAMMGSLMGGQLPQGTPPPPFSPPFDAIMVASIVVGLGVNTVLIIAGARLLKRHQTGRSLHLVYAIAAIFAGFLGSFAGYSSQQAQKTEMAAWIEQHGDANEATRQIAKSQEQQASMQGSIQAATLVGGLAISLAWPTFCIVWFGMVKQTVPPAYEF